MATRSAAPTTRTQRPASFNSTTLFYLAALLALPAFALFRISSVVDWRVLVLLPLSVSVVTFLAYRSDKARAQRGEWRIPESTLHLLALIGGWPGAVLAQQWLRHKSSKFSFQLVFWMIVATHQFLSVDSLMNWRLMRVIWHIVTGRN